ncbi:hypothetical protein JTF12_20115 [Leclercia adecarboxylata]|uniref:hypothetical protein n=1 Tax=Leclercia adecarboxylata TaxID=83655 RepID=UPI001952597B|nr:hypothetical protein [Leclercia adecarboxylata]MBM6636645.1 hypothetical protein [Leclercia adecarboxylata]
MKDYAWVFGFIGNCLVFVGWIVVYINAKNISTRSEIKSIVDLIVKNLGEVSDKGMKYWFSKGEDYSNPEHFDSVIMANLTLITEMIVFVKSRGIEVEVNLDGVINSLTLECDLVSSKSDIELSLRANEINAAIMGLITIIMEAFHAKYPPTHYVDLNKWCRSLDRDSFI